MTGLTRDLRYALRMLRRTPVFSTVATAVLAIAIAVATAVFSLYNHLALQPIPGIEGSSRLVTIGFARDSREWIPLNLRQYRQFSEVLTTPEEIFAVVPSWRTEVSIDEVALEASVAGVSPGFFTGLGVPMLMGADLDAASSDRSAYVVVISEQLWREQLGASPGVLGRALTLDDEEFTIVGVAGAGFQGIRRGTREEVWMPMETRLAMFGGPRIPADASPDQRRAMEDQRRQMRENIPVFRTFARLPEGVAVERFQQELDAVLPRIRAEWASLFPSDLMRIETLTGTANNPRAHEALVRQSQLLGGGAILVLLVASLNLASFFLARAPARSKELRTRMSIGATRGVVMRQLFIEAAMLVAIATAIGALLHFWLRTLLLRVPPFVDMPSSMMQVTTDWRVFVFMVFAAVVVAAVAGLLPAVRIALQPSLSMNSPATVGGRGQKYQPLLVLQVLVATFVVLAGTLFVDELRRLESAPVGFTPQDTMTAGFRFERDAMRRGGVSFTSDAEQMRLFMQDFGERLQGIPGVQSHAFAGFVPFVVPPNNPGLVEIFGATEQPPDERRRAYENLAGPDLFRVLEARFLHGRPMAEDDTDEIVVSRSLARQLWGRDDVVGERLSPSPDSMMGIRASGRGVMMVTRQQSGDAQPERAVFTVVGVLDDIRYSSQEDEYPPVFYRNGASSPLGRRLVVRGTVDPQLVHEVMDPLVRERIPPFTLTEAQTLRKAMHASLSSERARSRLALGAAAIALVLTMIGLYASMQHMVEARRNELALRKAIGADEGALVKLVLRRAGGIVALGCTGAALAMVFVGDGASALMFGLDALALPAWIISVIVVIGTGLMAAFLPALRAGRVDPAVALRYE
jgi:predicted permease